jgi:hypothetical protein
MRAREPKLRDVRLSRLTRIRPIHIQSVLHAAGTDWRLLQRLAQIVRALPSAKSPARGARRKAERCYHATVALIWLGIYAPVIKRFRIKVPGRRYLLPLGDRLRRAKWDVLAELGRARNAVAVRIFADRICESKPPAKQAVRLIRE